MLNLVYILYCLLECMQREIVTNNNKKIVFYLLRNDFPHFQKVI